MVHRSCDGCVVGLPGCTLSYALSHMVDWVLHKELSVDVVGVLPR
jgi:hypothetical protein